MRNVSAGVRMLRALLALLALTLLSSTLLAGTAGAAPRASFGASSGELVDCSAGSVAPMQVLEVRGGRLTIFEDRYYAIRARAREGRPRWSVTLDGIMIVVRNDDSSFPCTANVPWQEIKLIRYVGGLRHGQFDATGLGILSVRVILEGNEGDDILTGGPNSDVLTGGAGQDTLRGGDGFDMLIGGAGVDRLEGGPGWDHLVGIDEGSLDTLSDADGRDVFWSELRWDGRRFVGDRVLGAGSDDVVRRVARFANAWGGADLSLDGDDIVDPAVPDPAVDSRAPSGLVWRSYRGLLLPLFQNRTAARAEDINQGAIGDCKAMSAIFSLAANAAGGTWPIYARMADFGDGTYGVAFGSQVYRVDADFVSVPRGDGSYAVAFAKPGPRQAVWAMVLEKTLAYATALDPQRPRFWRLAGVVSPREVWEGFGGTAYSRPMFSEFASSADDFTRKLQALLDQHSNVVIGASSAWGTVPGGHAYALVGLVRSGGRVTGIQLFNPWGRDGSSNGYDDGNPEDGVVTLPLATVWGQGRLASSPGFVYQGSPLPAP